MDFWGFNNINGEIGMNNWFMPTFSYDMNPFFDSSFMFSNYPMPSFSFLPSLWNYTPSYPYTPNYQSTPVFKTNYTSSIEPQEFNNEAKTETQTTVTQGRRVLSDYNANAGKRLANIALKNSVGWTGYCARSVKNAICAAHLGSYKSGHAYQMTSILRNNKNFKEISAQEVNVKDLPAGCILVYDKGTQGYSKNYGHTEITTGDGRAVSDGITQNLTKQPSSVFIPVERNFIA